MNTYFTGRRPSSSSSILPKLPRELTKTTMATATGKSLNKRFLSRTMAVYISFVVYGSIDSAKQSK